MPVDSPLSSNPILIDDDWAALPWPPLSSLIVESVLLDKKLCAVINRLAPTLQHLDLTAATVDAIEDVLPNIALSLPHLTNLTLGNVRPELAASFLSSLGESENPAALYNLTLSLINYRPDDKLAKTINPFKHTLHIINCCTQPSGRLWLDDERKVTRIPGIVLNGGRKTDHFRPSQRYPITDATKKSAVIRRIAKYARSL